MKNKSLAFWGVEAPPFGGMTVHIQRLTQYLQKDEWSITQYNFSDVKRDKTYISNVSNLFIWYLGLWFKKSPKIHYVITTRAQIRFLASLLTLRGKKVIIRVGGESLKNEIDGGGILRLLNISSLKLCSAFIGVNQEICQIGEKYTRRDKIYHIPGFICPQDIDITTSKSIIDFFNGDSLNIVATGQVLDKGERDIYGLYHFIDALSLLKEDSFNYKALIVVYGSSYPKFKSNFSLLEQYILNAKLDNDVLLYVNEAELWPIIKIADLFVRPSITDGDANSIREALFLGKAVVASDCVPRPKKCILYKNLDTVGLANCIKQVKSNIPIPIDEEGNELKIARLLYKLM